MSVYVCVLFHLSVCMCLCVGVGGGCMWYVCVGVGGGDLQHIAKLSTNCYIFLFKNKYFFNVFQKVACKCRIICSSSFPSTEPCAAGTYSTDGLFTVCTPCDENTYQNSTGQSSCINCSAKTYTTTIGATSTAACRRKWQT